MVIESKQRERTSLVVQWLGLCTSTAGGTGSIPGWGTKILHASLGGQKTPQNQKNKPPQKREKPNIICLLIEETPIVLAKGF